MRSRWTVIVPILAALTTGGCRVVPEFPNGFRGLKWGAPVPDGWTFVGKEEDLYGGMDMYENPEESLTMEGATLESIRYYFWQNRLLDVLVKFKGYSNQKEVLQACEKRFGTSRKHHWIGPEAIISFEYDEIDKEGHLHMMSTVVLEAAEAFERAHVMKGPRVGR